MAQYKLTAEIVNDLIHMKDKGVDALCFFRQNGPGSEIHLSYYNYDLENGNLILVRKEDTLVDPLEDSMHPHTGYAGVDELEDKLQDALTMHIGGVPVPYIKAHTISQSRDRDNNELYPIPTTSEEDPVEYKLVYFSLSEILAVKNNNNEIYLTDTVRHYSNIAPVDDWNSKTPFTSLHATPNSTFHAGPNIIDSLKPADGTPCPPFWEQHAISFEPITNTNVELPSGLDPLVDPPLRIGVDYKPTFVKITIGPGNPFPGNSAISNPS